MYIEQNPDLVTNMVPLSAVSSQPQDTIEEEVTSASVVPDFYSQFAPTIKFKVKIF